MFHTILIANRGEIACRIIATCRRLGIACVAVYSEADARAQHVRLADRAFCIGPAPARESYLRIDRLLDAARRGGAEAIHPGYGFLSENPEFAQQCAQAGLVFIGPTVAAMRAMSSKAEAKRLMEQAGVPLLPGYHGDEQNAARLQLEAARIGYPVLIKASAGGGGKGMRIVEAAAQFDERLAACQREARSSFDDEHMLIEKFLPRPRHVEVQLFGDSQGGLVHLHERDCSAQRRHQKVLEEAPAPGLTSHQRAALTAAALAAGRAVHYVGAGTVEFLLDTAGHFYFLEMNTRIQVEHPVTEMITGIDLVEWQLRVAAGGTLPLAQSQIPCLGHAVEARLYAESPEAGFLPATGTLQEFVLPAATDALRLETGVAAGDAIGIDYDPMLAKLIVHAATREAAVTALRAALAEVRIAGVDSNLLLLRRLAASEPFSRGPLDTGFIEREGELLMPHASPPSALVWAAAALWTVLRERAGANEASPWALRDGWRLNGALQRRVQFETISANADSRAAARAQVLIDYEPGGTGERGQPGEPALQLTIDGVRLHASLRTEADGDFTLWLGDQALRLRIEPEGELELRLLLGTAEYRLRRFEPLQQGALGTVPESGGAAAAQGAALCAPMPGRIIAHLVPIGQPVEPGDSLLVMEAMKMEHALSAPARGVVRAFLAAVGEQVTAGSTLIEFEPQP